MKKFKLMSAFVMLAFFVLNCQSKGKDMNDSKSVYDFTVKNIDGKEINLSDYKGKVLLVVNTASECGFTPQYEGLEKLYKKFKDKGFEILAFPCNQFGGQEPGSKEEIKKFCSTQYSVTFPIFDKIEVNGDNADSLYKYLKSEQSGLITDNIKWNFTKFLIDKNGKPVKRYASQITPDKISTDIEKELK